jgi:uncharacterized protein (TIGR03437 family)
MNRLHLLLSKVAFGAILLFAVASSAVYAQVNYTMTGTLSLVSGPDPISLSGSQFTATTSISQTMAPLSSATTNISSTNTYSGPTVDLTTKLGALVCSATATPAVSVTLTDNVDAADTLVINNCSVVEGLATFTASVTIPDGNIITAVPAAFPSVNVTGSVTISFDGTPTVFDLTNATLVATGTAAPSVIPSPTAWTPSAQLGSTTPLTQNVTFTTSPAASDIAVSFLTSVTTTGGGTWLSVAPAGPGANPAGTNTSNSINITVNPTGLTGTSYTGSVILTYGPGYPTQTIPVTFTLTVPLVPLNPPSPTSMTFNYMVGGAAPTSQPLSITSSSSIGVNAAVTSGNSWLSVSPASGSTPAAFTVSVNTTGLTTAQTLTGNVQITSSGASNGPLNIPVTYNVTVPTLTVPSTPLTFNYTIGGTAPAAQLVSVGGTSGISFTATAASVPAGTWLSVSPGSGTVSSSSAVSVAVAVAGLTTAGTYNGTVTVSSPNATGSPTMIPVTLNVIAPVLTASPSQLNFAFQIGGTAPVSQNINVGDASNVNFTATAATSPSGGTWLSVSPGSGSASGTLTVSVNTTGLTANTYTGTISIAATGAVTQTVNVSFVVSTLPTISSTPMSLSFTYQLGSATLPAAQTLTIGGTAGLNITATAATIPAGGTWLSAAPVGAGTTPGSVSVAVVNTTGLGAGTYNGTVTIGASGVSGVVPQVVTVSLVISASLTTTSSGLNFTYTLGGTAPAMQSISVGGSQGLTFSAAASTNPPGGSWLSAAAVGPGTLPGSVNVTISTTGLTAGTYNGTVTISASGATSLMVPVTLVVSNSVTVSPSTLSFTYTLGTTAPAAQSINVTGTAGVAFTAAAATTSGGSWLSATAVSPATTNGTVSVSIVPSALTSAGTYNGTVTVTPANSAPQVVSVSIVVSNNLTVSSTALSFTYTVAGTAPAKQTFNVGGTSGVAFTVAAATTPAGGTWLSASAVSPSTISGSVNVSIVTTGLTAGTYNGTVTISAANATAQQVGVTLVVSNNLTATPAALTFNYTIGDTVPAVQSVSIGGVAGQTFTATAAGGAWLSASAVSPATTPGTASVSVNITGLAANTYTGTVTIASPGSISTTINVTLIVITPPFVASPASLSFKYTLGGAEPLQQGINITSPTTGNFTAAVGAGASWLSVAPTSGTLPVLLTVTTTAAGLTAGTYNSSIIVTSAGVTNSPFSIPVTLVVSGATPNITLSATSLSFTATTSGAAPAAKTVNVTSSTPTTVTVLSQGGTWLSASLSSSTTPATVSVAVNQANLAAGTYTGTVSVSSAGAADSPQNISVQFVVSSSSTLTVSPAYANFTYTVGGTAPAPQTINVTAGAQVTIATTTANGSWFTLTSSASTTPAALTISVSNTSLPAGNYSATITITSPSATNAPFLVPVTLVVSGKPTLAPSPTSLTFTGQSGGANPASQSISLAGVTSAAVPFSITTSPSWLSVSTAATTTPATLVATVNTTGMIQGSYQGSITITSSVAGNSPVTIPVALNLTASLVVTTPTISSIVNAASYDSSGFSPGGIVSIFGSLLGPQTGVSFTVNSKGSLDDTLGGANITVGGVPAIPLFVQNGQVNVILPYTLATTGQANVVVQYNNLTSADFSITLTPADVQIFTANASGSGPGSILNQDFSVNTASNPAAPGSVVAVYGTGGGAVSPAVVAGNVAGDTLSWISGQYSATVNGENAVVLYAGSAPGLVYGVYQFNVQLPTDLPAGPATIILNVAGSVSQPNVTVFVN